VIKHTVEISREPAHLSIRNRQLVLKRDGKNVGQIPCEDIGVLLVDHPQTTYTHAALTHLAQANATVVICGANHLPTAIVLPIAQHSQVVWRQNDQIGAKRPLLKQLWKQVIVAKIRGQAANLPEDIPAHRKLLALSKEVRSGDPSNIEAYAAKIYWANWLGEERFRRDADGTGRNAFLNYGYAIVRAAVARAIVAAGLLPSLGIHHRNRGNAFCLADDLVEPLRPLVDDQVRDMVEIGYEELNQPAKAQLLELLTRPMRLDEETGPLMAMLHRMVASLVQCYAGESRTLRIPTPC